MDTKVKEEAEKLKELYKTSSKVFEVWPKSDLLSSCDDITFAEFLENLTDVELEAAVYGMQRLLDVEQLLVKNLECLKMVNGESPDTISKLILSQEKLARLRSRHLRCLCKQLNNSGHKECVLPPWHCILGKRQDAIVATTAEKGNQEGSKHTTYSMRDASCEDENTTELFNSSENDTQSIKSVDRNSLASTSENSEQLEQDALSSIEIGDLHWVEPNDVYSAASEINDTKTELSTKLTGDVKEESSRQKDASQGDVKAEKDLKVEETGLKKIQETLKKVYAETGQQKQKHGMTSPPPKPAPYSPEGKKAALGIQASFAEEEDDSLDGCLINEQPQIQDWDPTLLLHNLFGNTKDKETTEKESSKEGTDVGVVRMSGYMEKLPSTYKLKKSSVFKGWKRRHFKAFDGKLFYFEDHRNHEPLGMVDLKGSSVIISSGRMLELIDSEGKASLKLRCSTPVEAGDWKEALEEEAKSQEVQNEDTIDTSPEGSVVVIDLGSSSIKAGFASEEAWPQLVFPCVCAELKEDDSDCIYGFAALAPERRKKSILRFPLRRSLKIDKLKYSPAALIGILEHSFNSLKVDPSKHKVIMTLPQNTSPSEKGELVEILLGMFGVEACYLQQQSILAMYSYSAVSGIIVDIGDHIDVIPVVEGCVIEAGASRLPYGGRQVTDMLARLLTENGHRFFSEVETYITRHIKEKACYVNENRISNEEEMPSHPCDVMLTKYNLPDGTKKVTFDTARYRCTEGLFEPHVWGKDHPGIHDLTYKAIMACSMDVRKQMCRSIYLSGGGSMLPGFAERLQAEVSALLPQHNIVQVHAGTDRHFAAFIGASVVASLPVFEELCITQDDWNDIGTDALEKWQNV